MKGAYRYHSPTNFYRYYNARGNELYVHASETIGADQQLYDGLLTPEIAVNTLRNADRLLPTRTVLPSDRPRQLQLSEKQIKQVKFSLRDRSYDLFDFFAVNRISEFIILKDGKISCETYQLENTPTTRWTSVSIAK